MRLFFFIPDLFKMPDYQDFGRFTLLRLQELGFSGFRIFLQYSWDEKSILSPYPKVGYWQAGYNDAPDLAFYDQGDEGRPRWDSAWLELNEALATFLKRDWPDCTIILTLHDFSSIKQSGWRKYLYPFLSSAPDKKINNPGYDRYPGGFWGMGENSVQFLHKRYAEKVMEIYKGLDFMIEFCNEDGVLDWPDSYANDYYRWLTSFIPPKRLLVSGRWACIQPESLYSQHNVIRPWPLEKLPPINFSQLILSGDGAVDGSGPYDASLKRGLGEAELNQLAPWVKDLGFAGYEYMDRGIWAVDDSEGRLCLIDWKLAKKVAEAFFPKIKMNVCKESGLKPNLCCPETIQEEFEPGDEPQESCYIHYYVGALKCLKSNKLAGPWCTQTTLAICSQELADFITCDKCRPGPEPKPCSYWLKKLNIKRWLKCIFNR